ncbi:hypothetical protein ABH926_007079 [Catenulispora sp. GP43]|uniref:hypothetical protein n=1 Tax=Catenulispora sp. GP43 TaxID=3156263 RepID=UPI0035157CCF
MTVALNDPEYRLALALEGFRHAGDRYRAAADDSEDVTAVFIPLSETLLWAASVDETFKKLDGQRYADVRDVDADGRYLVALRYARNRCTHQLALVAERKGLAPPFRPPITPGVFFRWRPIDELPPPDSGHMNVRGEAAYEDLLAKDPADQAIIRAHAWFARWTAQRKTP